jgi:6-hydroxycyclohex-1-ene-1-carbonyl-CoA dehydrogenase
MRIASWVVERPGAPMVRQQRDEDPGPGAVIVEVAGCGVCHTDLGFYYDGVPTKHPFPLALGHEISGRVVAAGPGAEDWLGRAVVVPAVMPCGECAACGSGHGQICSKQVFPGNDVHGGFGTHVVVPARGLCRVPDLKTHAINRAGLDLPSLSVVADAVSTAVSGHPPRPRRDRVTRPSGWARAAWADSACRFPPPSAPPPSPSMWTRRGSHGWPDTARRSR